MSFKSNFISENKSEQYISTVWLLSLLNKRQLLPKKKGVWSKISKKDILNVSIPTTCRLIETDNHPLQLKQISHFLYGISMCYCKKSEFILEDLTLLLTQIHNSIRSKGRINDNSNRSKNSLKILDTKHNTILNTNCILQDDSLFNINDIENFELFLSRIDLRSHQKFESVQIKRNDFLNELNNYNISTNLRTEFSEKHNVVRNLTLEELPVDFSLDLNVEDIISQQGTTRSTSSLTHKSNLDIQFREEPRYYGERNNLVNEEINSIVNFDLEISPEKKEHVIPSQVQQDQNFENSQDKKRKLESEGRKNGSNLKRIKIDTRISLLTETLKTNHETYVTIMESLKRKSGKNVSKNTPKGLFSSGHTTKLVKKCWNFLLSKDIYSFLHKQALHPLSRFEDDTSSIDIGRKLINLSERSNLFLENEDYELFKQDENNSSNVLLHLDQIEEDLNEEEPLIPYNESIENGLDFMKHSLNLPPSSIGYYSNRTATTNPVREETDFVDILKLSKIVNNKRLEKNDQHKIYSDMFENRIQKNMEKLRNSQNEKFYSYLCNKFYEVEGCTEEGVIPTNVNINDGLSFGYLIPDRIEDFETKELVPMTKQIAANAFFSLLNLAAQDIVELKVSEPTQVQLTLATFHIII